MARSLQFLLDFFIFTALNSLWDCWNEQKLSSQLDPELILSLTLSCPQLIVEGLAGAIER